MGAVFNGFLAGDGRLAALIKEITSICMVVILAVDRSLLSLRYVMLSDIHTCGFVRRLANLNHILILQVRT